MTGTQYKVAGSSARLCADKRISTSTTEDFYERSLRLHITIETPTNQTGARIKLSPCWDTDFIRNQNPGASSQGAMAIK